MRSTVLADITTSIDRSVGENAELIISAIDELYFMLFNLDLSKEEDRLFLKLNITQIKRFYEALERSFINEYRASSKK